VSRWKTEFENHAIHESIRQSQEWLDVSIEEPDEQTTIELRRLKKVLDNMSDVLASIDPEFAPIGIMDQVNQHLRHQNFWNQLNAFHTSHDAGNLTNANNHISAQASAIHSLTGFATDRNTTQSQKSLEETFDSFCSVLSKKSEEFSQDIDSQEGRLDELKQREVALSEAVTALDHSQRKKNSEWQEQFSNDQSQRATDFSNKQIERDESFSEWFQAFEKEKEARIVENEKAWDEKTKSFFGDFTSTVDGIKNDAESRHASILEMHGLVAEDSVAGGYKSLADHERGQANTWRLASIAFIISTVLWIALTYWNIMNISTAEESVVISFTGEFNWAQVAKVASLTAVLLYGAVFSSKQSTLHRENEKRTRWFALEIKAIGPFIESLDETTQKELIAKFSERLFGQELAETKEVKAEADFDPNVLKAIGGMVKDISTSRK
jgi:hypothetical protein